jgi:hypothetical protein
MISEYTRIAIIDHFIISQVGWSGKLQEDEFLARLYNLKSMSSSDERFWNAIGDIRQHRSIWRDWKDDWVFTDSRFDLLHETDECFLRFLCETVHPEVRPSTDEALSLVEFYNRTLEPDGWRIVELELIAGKPVFTHQLTGGCMQ